MSNEGPWKARIKKNARGYLQSLPFGILLLILWPIIGLAKSLPAATVAVVFSVLIEQNWKLRRDRLFQVVVSICAVVHVIAIWLIPFGRARSGAVAIPVGFLDYYALDGLIRWIKRRSGRAT